MQLIPWADDSVNLKVVAQRLQISTPDFPSARPPGIYRAFHNYLWTSRLHYHSTGPFVEKVKPKTSWSQLKPGCYYMVVAFRPGLYMGASNPELCAAVMQFRGYELLPADECQMAADNINFHVEKLRKERKALKHFEPDSDDDEEMIDRMMEDRWEREYQLNDEICFLKEDLFRRKYAMKFKSMNGTERVHTIKLNAPIINACPVQIEVLDLVSTSWTARESPAFPKTASQNSNWKERMNELRRLGEKRVLHEVASCRIQRAWRRSRSNPEYSLCKKRLLEEFEAENEELKMNHG